MLDENTKISLRNVVAALIFIGGIVYGWQVTVGSIENRLSVLEENSRSKDQSLTEIKTQVRETDNKVDRLLMANGLKPEQ
jgi:hypothetical protein